MEAAESLARARAGFNDAAAACEKGELLVAVVPGRKPRIKGLHMLMAEKSRDGDPAAVSVHRVFVGVSEFGAEKAPAHLY